MCQSNVVCKSIIVLSVLLLPFLAEASLYKVINEFGDITFTDTPPSIDAKEHTPGRINAVVNPLFNQKQIQRDAKAAAKEIKKEAAAKAQENSDSKK